MKRFLYKLTIFLLLLISIDWITGNTLQLYNYTKRGEIHKIHSIMTKESPEFVILGSSRATHHYIPQLFRDSLGIGVFNAGLDGQGIPMAYCFLKGLTQRKFPKYIICEITPKFDLYKGIAPLYLNDLYPYVNIEAVNNLIIDFDRSESIKLKSNLYRYNSTLFRLLPAIAFDRDISEDGYIPLYGNMKSNSTIKKENIDSAR